MHLVAAIATGLLFNVAACCLIYGIVRQNQWLLNLGLFLGGALGGAIAVQ